MEIRPLLAADCDGLASALAALPGNLDVRHELARPLTRAWVACAPGSGALLGYLLAWWVLDELELVALATEPSVRRRGVARALLAHLDSCARAGGARRITLEVARGNLAALGLYRSAGFQVFNVRRGYYHQSGDDALEMELLLTPD